MPATERTARPLKPLLRPRHFNGLMTQLTPHGLAFDYPVEDIDRRGAGLSFRAHETRTFLDEVAGRRAQTRVVLHPDGLPAATLRRRMFEAHEHDGSRGVGPGCGLKHPAYDTHWHVALEDGPLDSVERAEGADLVAVAFDAGTPVGFCALAPRLYHCRAQHECCLLIQVDLVYVLPKRRGEGFGLDLSIACSEICTDLLRAGYAAVPAHTTIQPFVCAAYESHGGETFSEQVARSLSGIAELLNTLRRRPTVTCRGVELLVSAAPRH